MCYEVLLMGIIDSKSMNQAKIITHRYLVENGYEIHEVKCDLENNPPESIDIHRINIDIFEVVIRGSSELVEAKNYSEIRLLSDSAQVLAW